MSEKKETSLRQAREQKDCDETFYNELLVRQWEEDGSVIALDPDFLKGLGPETTVILCEVLREEWHEAHNHEMTGQVFWIFPSEVATRTGLRVRKAIRILEELSDLPPNIRSRHRFGYILVKDRGRGGWRVAINDDRLWPDAGL
jgi:hypothetical protein